MSPSLLEHYKSMNTTEEQNASLGKKTKKERTKETTKKKDKRE